MGAYVVYDPYWDPHWAYATDQEAQDACEPGGKYAGCHVIFDEQANPGPIDDLPYLKKPWDD